MTSSLSRNKFLVRSALRANNFARTPRKPNWSEVECEYLLQEIQKNLPMIRSRKPDGQGSRKSPKADMWNRMCMGLHVNRPTVMRSVRDLKDKWKKLQFMAKQHISRIRFNSMPNRGPDGLIIIPNLVYRVLEARGQDPKRLGFGIAPHGYELSLRVRQGSTDATGLILEGDSSEQEPAGAFSLVAEQNTEGNEVKEEITDVDELYQDESLDEPDFTLQIQGAVSLNPTYNQNEHDIPVPVSTSTTGTNSVATIPVSVEKAVSSNRTDIRSTSFSISSRLLQHRAVKTSTTNRNYRQHSRANGPIQSSSRPHQRAIFNDQLQVHNQGMETSQPHFHQDVREDPSAVRIELDDTLTSLDDLQDGMSLEAHDQPLPQNSGPESQNPPGSYYSALRESPTTPLGTQPRRLCQAGLFGHVCDEQVVELQRDVLREERDKIRLEKEILEMQREKLKLELMVLRRKINGM